MAATEPIRDKNQLRALGEYFLKRGQLRNYALIVVGAHTALRISDLLRLKWSDVYDEERGEFRAHVAVIEKKTGKTKTIALNKCVLNALRLYFPHRRSEFIFASNRAPLADVIIQCNKEKARGAEALTDVFSVISNRLQKFFGGGWSNDLLVGDRGVEPLTSSTSKTRSSQLS